MPLLSSDGRCGFASDFLSDFFGDPRFAGDANAADAAACFLGDVRLVGDG